MTDALLLNKLINDFDKNTFLYQCYEDSKDESDIIQAFNKCVDDLKKLSDLSYNFEELTAYSKKYDIARRDVRQLCEVLSAILGDSITQLCSNSRELIITAPSKFEDFCPFPKYELVVYTLGNSDIRVGSQVRYDGYMYEVVDSRPENTPYYYINCNLLEKKS